MSNIPDSHNGVDYQLFLEQLSAKRGTQRYLEVGVNRGHMLAKITARIAIGVDPSFALEQNVSTGKKITILVQEPSDTFFKSEELKGLLGGPPDLCFLDGLHTFDFLLRDFMNAEKYCSKNSLIALHDCLPMDDIMITRSLEEFGTLTGSRFPGWWTGDVWKTVSILNKYRKDLRIVYVDCPPTGLVLISNLNPLCQKLDDSYFDILDEYAKMGNRRENLENFYRDIEITNSHKILKDFDHSLYFKA